MSTGSKVWNSSSRTEPHGVPEQFEETAQASALPYEADSFGDDAHGRSIMRPSRGDLKRHLTFLKGESRRARFAKETSWAEFLLSLPAK